MPQNISGKNMNIKLPDATYEIVFNKSLEMSKEKRRKVGLVEATLHIINDWAKKQKI
jgi:hypothetical protein